MWSWHVPSGSGEAVLSTVVSLLLFGTLPCCLDKISVSFPLFTHRLFFNSPSPFCCPFSMHSIPGRYTSFVGNSSCTDCTIGLFANGVNSTSCKNCPKGRSTSDDGGSAACSSCSAGSFKTSDPNGDDALYTCTACVPGLFSAQQNSVACIGCLPGFHQPNNSSGSCLPCIPGKATDQPGQVECKSCRESKYAAAPEATACEDCLPGFHQPSNSSGSCLPCIPGKATDQSGQVECESCRESKYAAEPEATVCENCPTGRTAGNGSAACAACPDGTFGDGCGPCPFGKHRSSSDDVTDSCRSCDIGQYSDQNAQASCQKCNAGYYESEKGQDECKTCPANWFSDQGGQSKCKECGSTATSEAGKTFCSECTAGKFIVTNSTTSLITRVCDKCPVGWNGLEDPPRCEECDPGMYQALRGKTYCLPW